MNSASDTLSTTRHPEFYHVDIYKVDRLQQVENHLYKVHRSIVRRESVVFESMFSIPPPEAGQEGQSDSTPIVLEGTTSREFEALLDYFYRGPRFDREPESSPAPTSSDQAQTSRSEGPAVLQDYVDLLSIASRFECTNARRHAIKGIDALQPSAIDRVAFADQFDVPQWLLPAYVDLCKRNEPLKEAEAMRIGFQKTCLIAKAREIIRSSEHTRGILVSQFYRKLDGLDWPPGVFEEERVTKIIMEVFWPDRELPDEMTSERRPQQRLGPFGVPLPAGLQG
ncbi:hypothetical protein V5O48_018022 [Marasmius crinis-equi]|uniref:BTB domain-containing protein n=1 Tax=Marasmius crinis-equi TaxID=585013 RepID=A0ABR3EMC7_9AGAR